MENVKLYRKRLIPFETVLLKDDKILVMNEEVVVTKWNVLKPRKDFTNGYSCVYLKRGYKVSKFLDNEGNLVYYYCDIVNSHFDKSENAYIFTDLLADVIIYPDGKMRVVDLAEIAIAMDSGLIDNSLVKEAIVSLDSLLDFIFENGVEVLIEKYIK